jgi:phosphoglycolate phosphatase-like HAD superfamily hydrolase
MSDNFKLHTAVRWMPIVLVGAALCVPGLLWAHHGEGSDPLPSWRNGEAKLAILDFVRQVTDRSAASYVKPAERIATFDDDGTLWTEWPRHVNQVQIAFARQRVKEMKKRHWDWKYQEPFKSIINGDDKEFERRFSDLWNRLDLLRETHGGMTVDEFAAVVQSFLATARHSKFKVPYTELAYQPMLELLDLLRKNEFKIYIVSGGGADFIRELSEPVYGVPRECVIGSTPEYEYRETPKGGFLLRTTNVQTLNDRSAKAESIQLHIGRKPILTAGNNDGDLAMMGLAAGGKNPFLNLLVRHDDAEREYAYDDNSSNALAAVRARGWTTVSMKNDFMVVFSFQENSARLSKK